MPTSVVRALWLSFLALLLSSGVVLAQRSGEEGVTIYRVDPKGSEVRLLVYRDGVLSTFGHNHTVSMKEFTGTIRLQPKLAQSRVELDIPVDKLVIDDAAARGQEGPDFASQPSENDVAGTRTNMLSAALLNAGSFPAIKVTGTSGPVDAKNSAAIDITVQIVGKEIKLTLPATLKLEGDQLQAEGETELTHAQLGLKPFSALLGSLRVADQMKFKYRIRASKVAK